MWGGSISRQKLQYTINRLRTLNEVPGEPKANEIAAEEDPNRSLSISRVREITSNLAFLSLTSHDPLKVMPVSVEERSIGEGITIRIAANKRDLFAVTKGLKAIPIDLERAARRGWYFFNSVLLLSSQYYRAYLSRGHKLDFQRSHHSRFTANSIQITIQHFQEASLGS